MYVRMTASARNGLMSRRGGDKAPRVAVSGRRLFRNCDTLCSSMVQREHVYHERFDPPQGECDVWEWGAIDKYSKGDVTEVVRR